jgi:hypothetical protein
MARYRELKILSLARLLITGCVLAAASAEAGQTRLLFGDTHLHTSYSFDAYLNRNLSADPDTAYRWARGLPVVHPYNHTRVSIGEPLDFLVVSDHAELMGVMRAMNNGTAELEDLGPWDNFKRWLALRTLNKAIEEGEGSGIFNSLLPRPPVNPGGDPVQDPANVFPDSAFGDTLPTERTAWHEIVEAAEHHNLPGEFTTFVGWEWSSIPVGANLHRVVFSPDGGDTARQYVPFGSDQSGYPEDLWQWLEDTQARTGARFLAMPHNSNISKGYMYAETTLKGEAISAEYAARRMRWEPVSEITQIKGDSETHPSLSPDDPFADFETYPFYIQQEAQPYSPTAADYMRSALRTGLALGTATGVNPYQFGVIGSTDAHSGLSSAEEDNFWGKFARDSTPGTKRSEDRIGGGSVTGWHMSASGLAAVWSSDNTRDAIFEAFQRREVYATTGPRLSVQVFGGWSFSAADLEAIELAAVGYAGGVPMGGVLPRTGRSDAPRFLVRALKDPDGAGLDRVQIVKGWVDADGATQEQVYDVVWAGDRQPDSDGRLPPIGNSVDLETGRLRSDPGSPALEALWVDPDFDPAADAFYYVRVLQVPTARHSLLDAIALQREAPEEGPATLQERAYTSPIWYRS